MAIFSFGKDISRSEVVGAIEIVTAMCKHFEGLYLRPYLCSAGVPTIGYGATFYESGRRVMMTDPAISRVRAEQLLRWHLTRRFLPAVTAMCHGAETPQQVAALTDFAFNLGTGALKTSTLRRKVNAGLWDEVPGQLMRWNKAGGRVLRGLTRRRQAEVDLL